VRDIGRESTRTAVATATPTLEETVRGRRSIRRYSPREVREDVVMEILDLARHAPSSMDGQPCCFIVVRERAILERLADIKNDHCALDKRDAYPAHFVASAPVVVAICVERKRAHGRERENGILAAAHLLLAAHARGLGGVYMTAYQADDPVLEREIRDLLGLPPSVDPVALIPLGFPAEEPAPKELRPLGELVHHESYGSRGRG
jgi:nitroreductase